MSAPIRLLAALLAAFVLAGCQLQDSYSGRVILSGRHQLESGETLAGDLLMTGGSVYLPPGARVTGSLHLLNGTAQVAGEIDGDVTVIAGRLFLEPEAVVRGDLRVTGGQVTRAESARVLGSITLPAGDLPETPASGQAGRLLTTLVTMPLLAGLAYLAVRFLPAHTANVRQAATRYWLPSAAIGLLGWVVGLSLLLLMAYTVLLIPLSLLGFFAMLLATSYGAVSYALVAGEWIGRRLGWSPSKPVLAAVGMAALVVLVEVVRLIPVVGGILPLGLFASAFGAALLTRFGLHRFVPPNPEVAVETNDGPRI